MPSINEVLERVARVRPDNIDDQTKAAWLIELDGKLYTEVIMRHDMPLVPILPDGEDPAQAYVPPQEYPEDGDLPLLVQSPYDNMYDLYLMAQSDLYNREGSNYNVSAQVFNAAMEDWKRHYHREHMPQQHGYYKTNVSR